ncbi:Transposase, partial [Candidatus Arcanobacter lacustris]
MPKFDNIVNLPGMRVKKCSGYDPVIMDVIYRRKAKCPHCGVKDLRKKDKFEREIKHTNIGLRKLVLRLTCFKYQCKLCLRYFNTRLPGIQKYRRSSETLRREVFVCHNQGISRKDLAGLVGLSTASIERCYHERYQIENKELKQRICPRVLGIDEHSFSKRSGYATTFCNLGKNKIFDVVKGKSARDLEGYLRSLEGREKVRVVCIDMSDSYHSIIRKWFPNAKIVADRFHVIRLINYYFIKQAQAIDPETKHKRGIIRLLRMHQKNMNIDQKARFDKYLENHLTIASMYEFKEKLVTCLLEKQQTKEKCKGLIPVFLKSIEHLKLSGFELLKTLGNTLDDWKDEIARMWRFTKSNGITEGFHRKMKLNQRRAYGFKNFENYRLRVK